MTFRDFKGMFFLYFTKKKRQEVPSLIQLNNIDWFIRTQIPESHRSRQHLSEDSLLNHIRKYSYKSSHHTPRSWYYSHRQAR